VLDPFLLLTVWFAADGRKSDGFLVGALAGLVQDAVGSAVFGAHVLSKVVVGYLVMHLAGRLLAGQILTYAVLCAAATVLEVIVLGAAGLMLGQQFFDASLGRLAAAVLVNAAVGTALFVLVDQALRRRGRAGFHAAARR
jgi:rod shape-determining protein MreD